MPTHVHRCNSDGARSPPPPQLPYTTLTLTPFLFLRLQFLRKGKGKGRLIERGRWVGGWRAAALHEFEMWSLALPLHPWAGMEEIPDGSSPNSRPFSPLHLMKQAFRFK